MANSSSPTTQVCSNNPGNGQPAKNGKRTKTGQTGSQAKGPYGRSGNGSQTAQGGAQTCAKPSDITPVSNAISGLASQLNSSLSGVSSCAKVSDVNALQTLITASNQPQPTPKSTYIIIILLILVLIALIVVLVMLRKYMKQ